ncbi:MAG: hypothetical protein IKU39_05805 [Lachnospiraceae bacterium]|nr:hypothetical protein [Lachnospiraceae bacterium]
MNQKLKKGIFTVLLANIVNVIFSLATNLLLPKYLSVESYAGIKTFQLYVSYVGILHLGYVDGIYLKYGGKTLGENLDEDFALSLSTIKVFQIVFTSVLFLASLFTKDWIVALFTITILPQNVSNYFKFLYQATGDFKLYGRIMNFSTISTFAINMFLLFLVRTDSYKLYIILYVLLYYVIWIVLEIQFRNNHIIKKTDWFSWRELVLNIKAGFLLTLGNISSMILTSLDRWFVKVLMSTTDFAQYSFAVSIENFLNLAITPVTTTLYNYMCCETSIEKQKKLFRFIIIFATVLPASAFPVKLILENFLQKYIYANKVIFILFAAQMFNIIVKSIFVNLYKVNRQQRRYFIKLVVILIVNFIFNIVFYQFQQIKEAFALGTLFSSLLWFVISVVDFRYYEIKFNEYFYLFSELVLFLFCGLYFNAIIGCLIYSIATVFMIAVFMNTTLVTLIQKGKEITKKRI